MAPDLECACSSRSITIVRFERDRGKLPLRFSVWPTCNINDAGCAGLSFVKTSNPNILMMQPTENRDRYDAAEPQRASRVRRIFVQRQVCADLVVVDGVSLKNPTQVGFAEHHEVIQALAPNRADQPLDVSVLPRRARRNRMIADAHRPNAPGVRGAERVVAVAQQMLGCFISKGTPR